MVTAAEFYRLDPDDPYMDEMMELAIKSVKVALKWEEVRRIAQLVVMDISLSLAKGDVMTLYHI